MSNVTKEVDDETVYLIIDIFVYIVLSRSCFRDGNTTDCFLTPKHNQNKHQNIKSLYIVLETFNTLGQADPNLASIFYKLLSVYTPKATALADLNTKLKQILLSL